jgi:hypothetical protein
MIDRYQGDAPSGRGDRVGSIPATQPSDRGRQHRLDAGPSGLTPGWVAPIVAVQA